MFGLLVHKSADAIDSLDFMCMYDCMYVLQIHTRSRKAHRNHLEFEIADDVWKDEVLLRELNQHAEAFLVCVLWVYDLLFLQDLCPIFFGF